MKRFVIAAAFAAMAFSVAARAVAVRRVSVRGVAASMKLRTPATSCRSSVS